LFQRKDLARHGAVVAVAASELQIAGESLELVKLGRMPVNCLGQKCTGSDSHDAQKCHSCKAGDLRAKLWKRFAYSDEKDRHLRARKGLVGGDLHQHQSQQH